MQAVADLLWCNNIWAAKTALGLRGRMEAKAQRKRTICLNPKGRQLLIFQTVKTEKGGE